MEFKLEDTIKQINENAQTIKEISPQEIDAINNRISTHMKEVTREFREKQNKSIESASKAFLTF